MLLLPYINAMASSNIQTLPFRNIYTVPIPYANQPFLKVFYIKTNPKIQLPDVSPMNQQRYTDKMRVYLLNRKSTIHFRRTHTMPHWVCRDQKSILRGMCSDDTHTHDGFQYNGIFGNRHKNKMSFTVHVSAGLFKLHSIYVILNGFKVCTYYSSMRRIPDHYMTTGWFVEHRASRCR